MEIVEITENKKKHLPLLLLADEQEDMIDRYLQRGRMFVLEDGGSIAALIKPQFEAGREKVGRKGVVRDPAVHGEVIRSVLEYASGIGLSVRGLTFSPITGPEGNIEYLIYLSKNTNEVSIPVEERILTVVRESHEKL